MRGKIVRDPIDAASLAALVRRPEAGAVVTFEGVVRNRHEGRRVDYIVYEAYAEMAERVMAKITECAVKEYGILDAAVAHRAGKLAVGDTAFAVAVSAAHRDEAFRACRFIVDEVKRAAPIWKKEGNAQGEEWVEAPRLGCGEDHDHREEGRRT